MRGKAILGDVVGEWRRRAENRLLTCLNQILNLTAHGSALIGEIDFPLEWRNGLFNFEVILLAKAP